MLLENGTLRSIGRIDQRDNCKTKMIICVDNPSQRYRVLLYNSLCTVNIAPHLLRVPEYPL